MPHPSPVARRLHDLVEPISLVSLADGTLIQRRGARAWLSIRRRGGHPSPIVAPLSRRNRSMVQTRARCATCIARAGVMRSRDLRPTLGLTVLGRNDFEREFSPHRSRRRLFDHNWHSRHGRWCDCGRRWSSCRCDSYSLHPPDTSSAGMAHQPGGPQRQDRVGRRHRRYSHREAAEHQGLERPGGESNQDFTEEGSGSVAAEQGRRLCYRSAPDLRLRLHRLRVCACQVCRDLRLPHLKALHGDEACFQGIPNHH